MFNQHPPSEKQIGFVTLLFKRHFNGGEEDGLPEFRSGGAIHRHAIFWKFVEELDGGTVSTLISDLDRDELSDDNRKIFINQLNHLGFIEFGNDYITKL